jgi:hypothetical protein
LKANLEKNPFLLSSCAAKIIEHIETIEKKRDIWPKIKEKAEELRDEGIQTEARFKSLCVSRLQDAFLSQGLKLGGSLPELTLGLLTLKFRFGQKSRVSIYYGPGIEELANLPFDIEKIQAKVQKIVKDLNEPPLNEERFLADLYKAYERVLSRERKERGFFLSIIEIMQEMAFLRQTKRFLADPRKELFRSYGRVRFSNDLRRLKRRTYKGKELRLVVASMEHTKQGKSLWVPQDFSLQGVHYSFLTFR